MDPSTAERVADKVLGAIEKMAGPARELFERLVREQQLRHFMSAAIGLVVVVALIVCARLGWKAALRQAEKEDVKSVWDTDDCPMGLIACLASLFIAFVVLLLGVAPSLADALAPTMSVIEKLM